MGNPIQFLAINIASPDNEYVFHQFDKVTFRKIWEEIIPDNAPNDLKYRLLHGPSYRMMEYDERSCGFIERPLRLPRVVYKDSRLYRLNEGTKSVYELSEFELILEYASNFQRSKKLPRDNDLYWILKDLVLDLMSFFAYDASRFDAVVLDYFM